MVCDKPRPGLRSHREVDQEAREVRIGSLWLSVVSAIERYSTRNEFLSLKAHVAQ